MNAAEEMLGNGFCPPDLVSFRRVVVKIGSSLLVDPESAGLRGFWLSSCVDDLFFLIRNGVEVLIVSSGAIALGRAVLGLLRGRLGLEDTQAAAAVGQLDLIASYAREFTRHDLRVAQILLTVDDTENRRRYLNASDTLNALLRMKVIPIVNENDTVATSEIRYGDNDRLAARIAAMVGADCLILLSDVDGLYTASPDVPGAQLVRKIVALTPEIEAMAGGAASELSRGGMITKLEAGKIAMASGTYMAIANGRAIGPLTRLRKGGQASWFVPSVTPMDARRAWILSCLRPMGVLFLGANAVSALRRSGSVLPKGIERVDGEFSRGDTVLVKEKDGLDIGQGLIAHDARDVRRIIGCDSRNMEKILGHAGRLALIHKDDFVFY